MTDEHDSLTDSEYGPVEGTLDASLKWLTANPAAAITVSGLIAFGMLDVAARIYYGGFAVTPELVGFGYQAALSQGAADLILIVLLLGLVIAILRHSSVAAQLEIPTYQRNIAELRTQFDSIANDDRRQNELSQKIRTQQRHLFRAQRELTTMSRSLALVLLAIPLIWAGVLMYEASSAGTSPRIPFALDPLQASARPAIVTLSHPDFPTSGVRLFVRSECVLLLGESNGQIVAYLPELNRTVLVPNVGATIQPLNRC